MQPQYARGVDYPRTRQLPGEVDDNAAPPQDNSEAMDCPECGRRLDDMKMRRKEAIFHYGSDSIPRYHNHDLAAERKGALLGVDPASLRG